MQIAVKGLLFGFKVKELKDYSATVDVTETEKQEYVRQKWRSFDAVDKLHNVVKYIRDNLQRREEYSIISDELQKTATKKLKVSVMNNDTQWSSVMNMIEYAFENRVHLEMYCWDINELNEDRLTEQNWVNLNAVHYY